MINTIMNADKIVVFEDGKITAIGTHNQLLERCKVYFDIAETQSSQIYS